MHKPKNVKSSIDSNQLLNEIALHALLHLHFKRLSQNTAFTIKAGNDIVSKWLKPKVKSNRYKLIKKALKTLLQQAKDGTKNIEELLNQCVGADNIKQQPDLDNYLLLMNEIEKKLGITVLLSRPEDVDLTHDTTNCLLCVLSENLNQHFNDHNALTKPISMLFRGPMSQRSIFLGSIYANNTFDYSVQYQDEQFVRITLEFSK